LMVLLQIGSMPKDLTLHNTALFAREVLPHVRDLWPGHKDRWWPSGVPNGAQPQMVLDRTLDIRDGAVRFRVLSGGRGPHLVSFHSFHERGGWSPFLDHLAARYTVLAPFHPGVQGSSGVETLDGVR